MSFSLFTDFDTHLIKEGKHYNLYEKLGAHPVEHNGKKGVYFAVWAPNASAVSVIGDFNFWTSGKHILTSRWDSSGIWEGFFDNISSGQNYKFGIHTSENQYIEKADPFAFYTEMAPKTASIIRKPKYDWKDKSYMAKRKKQAGNKQPFSIYEVHLGSWRRNHQDGYRSLSYRELAVELVEYVKELGFTHVEMMPVMEHPFFGSWGYQTTGYFAPSSRYGTPEDFMHLIDSFHQVGIGVILDWVPSHFPGDIHGLYKFDGTHLYEHADPRKGFHPDWNSYIFNLGRVEVKSFLISSAFYWFDKFHIDGIRVDAVASMLYLDYSRKANEWLPNEYGGNENIESIHFLKEFNESIYGTFNDVVTIAEESTAWPGVSRPTWAGGLGFGQKWMMGWMFDTLKYFSLDPVFRKYHQNDITFSIMYAFNENFLLPLSHDEVVYGKGSLLSRMPGDEWNRFANLRLLFGYMFVHPGTKLLFMGSEFAQSGEWKHDYTLEWHLLDYDYHKGVKRLISDLNKLYKAEKALYFFSFEPNGFEWIDYSDKENCVIAFIRKSDKPEDSLVVICNFTPVPRYDYRLGVPYEGHWKEIFSSDNQKYGGSGVTNLNPMVSNKQISHGRENSISLCLAPLSVSILKIEHGNL